MSVPYRDIPALLRDRLPFQGNSMRADWQAANNGGSTEFAYVVVSYATEIARVRPSGEVVISDAYYSRTTSRHQNLCRAWL